jgi:hypothetical protein
MQPQQRTSLGRSTSVTITIYNRSACEVHVKVLENCKDLNHNGSKRSVRGSDGDVTISAGGSTKYFIPGQSNTTTVDVKREPELKSALNNRYILVEFENSLFYSQLFYLGYLVHEDRVLIQNNGDVVAWDDPNIERRDYPDLWRCDE